jgi:hypothetical protein
MKSSPLVIVSILFLVLCRPSYAQMYPVTNTIRTPYGNVKTTQWKSYPTHNHVRPTGPATKTVKVRLEVTFSEDSVVTLLTNIHFDEDTAYFKMKGPSGKKVKVTPAQTKRIRRIPATGDDPIVGISADSCWLFPMIKGEVIGYSKSPNFDEFLFVDAVQKADGQIIPATKENLLELLADDEDAVKALNKKSFFAGDVIRKYNQKKEKAAKK